MKVEGGFVNRYLRRLLSNRRMSTARRLRRSLSAEGVGPGDIRAEHLNGVYGDLRRTRDAPDFDLPADLFADAVVSRIDESVPLCGVILETREHQSLVPVVLNILRNLDIPVQIFHGTDNQKFIESSALAGLIHEGKVSLTRLRVGKLEATRYNALLLTKTFWEHIAARRKLLFFQTDGISCDKSRYTIEEFMKFDYIGSKWSRERPVGLILDGGNGGVSLREWGKCYECLERFPPDRWLGGEDGYFAFHVELIGGVVGDAESCARFSTQEEFTRKSLFAHKISCLPQRERDAFLKYCGDARFILS